MHKIIEDNIQYMAPKMDRMLFDLRLYLGLTNPEQGRPSKGVPGVNNVIILCDQPSGLYVLLHMLRVQSIDYICIIGQGESLEWYQGGQRKKLEFDVFGSTWEKECQKPLNLNPTRVVVINTKRVAEGIDVLGVDLILGLSSYPNGSTMEQAFGRADRLCRRRMFRGPGLGPDGRSLIRKLYLVHYQESMEKPEVQTVQSLNEWLDKTKMDNVLLVSEAFLA